MYLSFRWLGQKDENFRWLGQIDFLYKQISLISIAPNKQKWNKKQLDIELSHKLTNFTMVQTTMGGPYIL
jgi:hypothetical protein